MRRDSAGVYAGAKVHVTADVVSGGVTYPGVYTIDLNAIDGDFVYAGLFTARACQVEFSNVSLRVAN